MKLWEIFLLSENVEFKHNVLGSSHGKMYHEITHTSHVDGHEVHVRFPGNSEGHYHAHFEVNGSGDNNRAGVTNTHTNKKVLYHVHHVLHSFIHKHKPASLKFIAGDEDEEKQEKKRKVYAHLADHVAKKYRGYAEHGEHSSEVWFP